MSGRIHGRNIANMLPALEQYQQLTPRAYAQFTDDGWEVIAPGKFQLQAGRLVPVEDDA